MALKDCNKNLWNQIGSQGLLLTDDIKFFDYNEQIANI